MTNFISTRWRTGIPILLLLGFASFCAAASPPPLKVRYRNNEAFVPGKDYFVVRSAFEVEGPPHQWIALDMEFRLSQAVPLVQANGKILLKRWNTLFLPDTPRPVRWTDCRLDMDFRDLEKVKNLPQDKTFVVWVMGLVYDYATAKHIGSGWSVRAPLLLTTDQAGKILSARAPTLCPTQIQPLADAPDQAIDVRQAEIRTKHLVPVSDIVSEARAYQAYPRQGPPVTVLTLPMGGQIWRRESIGRAFEAIDSAEKAEELVLMQHPGCVVLRTREQYAAVIEAVQTLGWAGKELLPAGAETFGVTATPVEGLGWRVRALLIEPRAGQLGDLVAWDYYVCTDGRLGGTPAVLVRGPGQKHKTPVGAGPYKAAIQTHLAREGYLKIDARILPGETIKTLPLPVGKSAEAFLPRADWPDAPRPAATVTLPASAPAPQPAPPKETPQIIITPKPVPIRR